MNSLTVEDLKHTLQKKANAKKAKLLQGYFKTGKGEYGEGDIFLGIIVPEQRKIAHQYLHLSLSDIKQLLTSPIHEHRFTALEILVEQYLRTNNEIIKEKIFSFYIKNAKYINNWDLVDTSAKYILGDYCFHHSSEILFKLVASKDIWERRMAVLAMFYFIDKEKYAQPLKIAKLLLTDSHDLIHKAVGWMLRELGKKSFETEDAFLQKNYHNMPRTMLRYALERFPPEKRAFYMKKL